MGAFDSSRQPLTSSRLLLTKTLAQAPLASAMALAPAQQLPMISVHSEAARASSSTRWNPPYFTGCARNVF